jgi:formylglycine-generating enzyme required for sulfatase activity
LKFSILILISLSAISCTKNKLIEITVDDFQKFISDTGYKTDAEIYDWSIVQEDVFNFIVLGGVNWKCPNGQQKAIGSNPVTQVSYNDATAYCKWSKTRLPTYEEYWTLTDKSSLPINQNGTEIFPVGMTNIIGNVWELTQADKLSRVRLAGGSYLCSPNSCNGTSQDRVLYIDQITGNSHIGFAVLGQ